jgi:hypothetical protein
MDFTLVSRHPYFCPADTVSPAQLHMTWRVADNQRSDKGEQMTIAEIKTKVLDVTSLLTVAAAIVVLCAGYLAVVLNVSYSKGVRVGYVQKFSEKGWLCKTWEGELQILPIAGAIPEKFTFSVRDKTAINKIQATMGKKVSLSYEQHRGIPTTCFGESDYFTVDATPVE